jgi:hypothetical protein
MGLSRVCNSGNENGTVPFQAPSTQHSLDAATVTCSPPFLCAAHHADANQADRELRTFWLASGAARDLIRHGQFERADVILIEMGKAGAACMEASATRQILGRRILKTAAELTTKYVEAREAMAADLAASVS